MDNLPLTENQLSCDVDLQHVLAISNPTTSKSSSVTPIRNESEPSPISRRGCGTVAIDIPEDKTIRDTSYQEDGHSLLPVVAESQLGSISKDTATALYPPSLRRFQSNKASIKMRLR